MRSKIKIILVAGARPNFVKIAPLMKEIEKNTFFETILVHTGQHYDEEMSEVFFRQLNIPEPDINLEVGSASQAVQTARIMERFEKVCLNENPDAVLVVGDVNSTIACVLTASKLHIKTIHYEAGVRSYDKRMPEEINRIVTDSICDYFITTSPDADEILISEGKNKDNIFMCGNLMIDSLAGHMNTVTDLYPDIMLLGGDIVSPLKYPGKKKFGMITIHRPVNVDDKERLHNLIKVIGRITKKIPVVFPVHPRTLKKINEFGIRDMFDQFNGLFVTGPLGYLNFISLLNSSKFLISDSGGIQEETSWLNIPCLTMRENTEWPLTISKGSNKLIAIADVEDEVDLILNGKGKSGKASEYSDGKSAARIVKVLREILN